jgi:hypothetical protein
MSSRCLSLGLLSWGILIAVAFSSCGRTAGAGNQMPTYKRTVLSGLDVLPWPRQMESLFGEGDHFIVHFGFAEGPRQWQTEIFFGGRYVLTMAVDVEVDYRNAKVVKAVGKPQFKLAEVRHLDWRPGAPPGATFSNEWTLDEAQWNSLVKANGDWAAVQITLKKQPVRSFDKYVNAIRKDRIQVR